MRNCEEVMELMQRDLDHDLNEMERAKLESHLNRCPECTHMYHRLKALSEDLESMPKVSPPQNIVDSILPRLQEQDIWRAEQGTGPIDDKRKRRFAAGGWKRWSAGMAAVFLIGVIWLVWNQIGSDTQPFASSSGNSSAESGASMEESAPAQDMQMAAEISEKTNEHMEAESDDRVVIDNASESRISQPDGGEKAEPRSATGLTMGEEPVREQAADDAGKNEVHMFSREGDEYEQSEASVQKELRSPSGNYTARVEERHIVVMSHKGETVYVSESFQEGKTVLVRWLDENRFVYSFDEEGSDSWIVDVKTGESKKRE